MSRSDPLRGFRFLLEMKGITSGGFARIKGINREVKHESHREGGVNDYEHKLVTQVSYPVLVLERGLALDDLWTWAQSAADGNIERRTLRIRLQDESGGAAWAWEVAHAIPVRWMIADLDAQAPNIAMETLELAHHGLRRAAT